MKFRTFLLPWAIAIIAICVIEGAIYAMYRPNIVERNDFLVQPIQGFIAVRAERWIIWNKIRKLPDQAPIAVQAGDSSGFYGIMPDVVSQYIDGQQLLNLSCCANQGFPGYLVLLELALRKYSSLRYAIVYVSPTVTLNDSQWISTPPDIVLSPGVTLPMLGDAMRSNFVSYRKYLYPPSNALRPRIYEYVLLAMQSRPIPPADREPNAVFERAGGMHVRNGYMIEHDIQTDIPGGCGTILAPRDPSTKTTYWDLFAEAFVALGKKYNVTPVLIFGPTGFAACEFNQEFRDEIARLRTAFPSLKIPYSPIETWPNNSFSVPAHVQRTFAIEASRRVGRALRALESGKELAENLAAAGPLKVEPKMRIVGATLTEECGWSPDYKNGYYGDVSAVIGAACDGKTACEYKLGSDARDKLQPTAGCKGVYITDYQCEGEPVRSFRQEGRNYFGGSLRIDCRRLSHLARDPMPYGIQIAFATFGGKSDRVFGNATTPVAARCQGLTDCAFAVDVTKLDGSANDSTNSLEIVYRCDRELATRVEVVAEAEAGKIVRFGCSQQSRPALDPISLLNATYGGECGAPRGNTDYAIATFCSGKDRCELPPLHGVSGMAAPSCASELQVEYRCGSTQQLRTAVRKEAGGDSTPLICQAN